MENTCTNAPIIIRMREVCATVGLSKASIYRMIASGTFPRGVPLGTSAKGWLRSEVEAWIMDRVQARDSDQQREAA